MRQLPLAGLILTDEASDRGTPKGAFMQSEQNPFDGLLDGLCLLTVKTIKRAEGRSAMAAAGYRAGCKMLAADGSLIVDYSPRRGVLYSEILAPAGAPAWVHNRNELWLEASASERRKNSVEAREFEIAIPFGVSQIEATELARQLGEEIVDRHSCVVDFSLHADSRKNWDGSPKNFHGFHVHYLLTTRRIGATDFEDKTRELDLRGSGEVKFWRERWAEVANAFMAARGIATRIDARSNHDRGIDRPPSKPLGHKIVALERRGTRTKRGDQIRSAKASDTVGT